MKITSIIVDDEPGARKTLMALLENYCPEIEVVEAVENVESGLRSIRKNQPDLVFLDIEMPGANGFQLLEQSSDKQFHVIFTTAYDEYALKAIRYSTLDYLLKPIDVIELQEAVEKVKSLQPGKLMQEHLNILRENLSNNTRLQQKLILPTQEGFHVTKLSNIIRCAGERNYTQFHFADGKRIMVSKTLKNYEELLPEGDFFRIHKSHIINLHEVIRYTRGSTGVVTLSDGSEIDISRGKRDEFLRRMSAIGL